MPAYMRLAKSLMDDIRLGIYPTGSRLPTENELCQRLKVSRHTVRDALRILVELGLVHRRPRAGTTVLARTPTRPFQPSVSSPSELVSLAGLLVQKVMLVEDIVVDAELATTLGVAPETHWRRVVSLLSFPEETPPLVYTQVYVPQAYADAMTTPVTGQWAPVSKPARDRIKARYGVRATELRERISAVALTDQTGAHLDGKPGSPGLELLLAYHQGNGESVEISLNLFRGDRYSYSARTGLPG